MASRIDDDVMSAETDGRVIATARYSSHAVTDGCGTWIVSDRPGLPFTRDQAITAMVLADGSLPAMATMTCSSSAGARSCLYSSVSKAGGRPREPWALRRVIWSERSG
jgi:hypothetical protein